MEELITNNVNQLAFLIFLFGFSIEIMCILILKILVDIKEMLKKHFKNDKKEN